MKELMSRLIRRFSPMSLAALVAINPVAGIYSEDASAAPAASKDPRPNILLIVADDMGYSDLGVFGSEIDTPNLDALAAQGRLLTSHYVSSACSPTRAMLMSGTDNHLVGLGNMGELLSPAQLGQPGYEGFLNNQALSMPEILRDAGYHTYMAGKWHLGLTAETGPKARGFESSYALLTGAGSHFAPVAGKPITADIRSKYSENGEAVTLPANFYSSDTYTDKLIAYIDANRGDGKPFFAYTAYTAPHWPLQAKDQDIARYRGRYDGGYEAIRQARIDKQKSLGLLPSDWQPHTAPHRPLPVRDEDVAARNDKFDAFYDSIRRARMDEKQKLLDQWQPSPGLPASFAPIWSQLTAEQKATEARKMEVYAAMIHSLDRNIGRLIRHLKDIGEYDNTLIVFQSDNGAEGNASFYPDNANTDNSLANIGRPLSNVSLSVRWAEVSATPFRLFKAYQTEGGMVAPAIVRMPRQRHSLPMLSEVTRAVDLLPTFMALAKVSDPGGSYAGRTVHPITGVSLLPALKGSQSLVRPRGTVIAGELFGSRFVRRDHWKLVSIMPPFGDNSWQLFDLTNDRGEIYDLAGVRTDIATELSQQWDQYAKDVGILFSPVPLEVSLP